MTGDLIDAIRRDLGAAPDADRVIPGRIVRFATNGKRADSAGWLMLFADERAAVYGDWRTDQSHVWRASDRRTDRAAERAVVAAAQAARAQESAQRHAEAAQRALLIWSRGEPCVEHAYLDKKKVRPDGLRVQFAHMAECRGQFFAPDADGEVQPLRGLLILVPLRDAERRLWSVQAIDADGKKSFLRGGRMAGMFHILGRDLLRGADGNWTGTIGIAEGFATAASVRVGTGWPVAVAFNAGNLCAVALTIRQRLPAARIVLAGDVDMVGKQKAEEAAASVGGFVLFPPFGDDEIAAGTTDWNDYHRMHGFNREPA